MLDSRRVTSLAYEGGLKPDPGIVPLGRTWYGTRGVGLVDMYRAIRGGVEASGVVCEFSLALPSISFVIVGLGHLYAYAMV